MEPELSTTKRILTLGSARVLVCAASTVTEEKLSGGAWRSEFFVPQATSAVRQRIGKDGKGLEYHGDSQLINSYGEVVIHMDENERVSTHHISKKLLDKHRADFPVGLDADSFDINP